MIPPATDYVEISLAVDGEAAEAVCELFERYGGGAVVETRMRSHPEDGHDLAVPLHWVRTYLAAGDSEARAKVEVGLWHLGQIYPLPEPEVRTVAHADWALAWKAHYTPQRIGRRFLIVPSWLDRPSDGPLDSLSDEPVDSQSDVSLDRQPDGSLDRAPDLILRLDPGMAFGTGLHPTTRLCLAALEDCVRPGGSVLDVGTGSDILAIGALLLGAARVLGVDIDPEAVRIAGENGAANGVALELYAGTLGTLRIGGPDDPGRRGSAASVHSGTADRGSPIATFDVVVANILAGTIVDLAPELAAQLAWHGVLVVSGILAEQGADVAEALDATGLVVAETRQEGDWVALVAGARHDGPP